MKINSTTKQLWLWLQQIFFHHSWCASSAIMFNCHKARGECQESCEMILHPVSRNLAVIYYYIISFSPISFVRIIPIDYYFNKHTMCSQVDKAAFLQKYFCLNSAICLTKINNHLNPMQMQNAMTCRIKQSQHIFKIQIKVATPFVAFPKTSWVVLKPNSNCPWFFLSLYIKLFE